MSPLGRKARSLVMGSLLLSGSAGLAAANWWLATVPVDISSAHSGTNSSLQPNSLKSDGVHREPRSQASLADLSAALVRPVFSPTRRPPKLLVKKALHHPPVAPPTLASTPAPRLIAVAISGRLRAALFSDPELPDGRWLNEGMQAQGWTLRSIAADQAVVQSGNQTVTLQLYEANGMPANR
jgi:hypothetical protein